MADFSGIIAPTGRLAAYSNLRRLWFSQSSWDRRWGDNWGGNVNLFDGWNVNWGLLWGGLFPGGFFQTKQAAHIAEELLGSGTQTLNRPIPLREFNHTGHLGGGFSDVFYNRILIEPISIDFETILSTQSQEIMVFNGFLGTTQLTNIIESGFGEGLSFSGETVPSNFLPLEERTYSVTATTAGPPQVEADLTFDWQAPIADITVEIVGSRIVLLPVIYSSGARETLVWSTGILNSYNGTEQRVRQRLSPRQQLAIDAFLSAREMHRVENLVYGWRKRIWAIPMWIEARRANAPVIAGDLTVSVDTRYGDFRVGRLAVLWESERKFDVFQISAKTDTQLTLNRGANDDFADPFVIPVRNARMLRDPVRAASGYDSVFQAQLEVTDNTTLETSASTIQFLNEDTFFMQPLTSNTDGANNTYQHRIDVVDPGSGLVSIFAPWDDIRIGTEVEYVLDGLEEIWEFREWLHRRAGRLRPFYMPTFENNFRLLSEGNVSDSFEAENNDYASQSQARNHIAFKLTDGTYVFATITGSGVNEEGNLDVTFTPQLNREATDIEEINFFGLKRLSSDRIEINWQPNNVAFVTIPMTEIAP